MAGIIDQFLIEIGWDTSGLAAGDKKIREQTKRTRDEARKDASEVERTTQRAATSFRQVRNEVSGLLLAFAGANSIKGFIGEMVTGAAAAGRLADNLGISIEKLSGVRSAVRSNGGTNADADTALGSLVTAFQNYQLTGTTGKDADFQGLGVTLADLADPTTALLKMAQAGERLGKPEFAARLSRIGIPASVITSLEKGRVGFQALTEEGERNANIHKQDAEAAQAFDKALNDLVTTIKGTAQPWITKLVEAVDGFLKGSETMNVVMPITIGLLGALAIATVAATWPWLTLASAIASATAMYNIWNNTTDDQKAKLGAHSAEIRDKLLGQIMSGDFSGAMTTLGQGVREGLDLAGGTMPDGTRIGAAGEGVSGQYDRLRARYGKERADAIWHGIGAESGWNPNSVNPTSGAFGLGQWLGSRKRGLFKRYGPNPSASQQIDYLMWELEGGDHGGASVLNSKTYGEALSNYVGLSAGPNSFGFMRPDAAGRAGDLGRAARFRGGAPVATGNTTSSSVSVGQIIVYSPDPEKAGENVQDAVRKRGLVVQSNTGMQQ